jgi:hypothetical protein
MFTSTKTILELIDHGDINQYYINLGFINPMCSMVLETYMTGPSFHGFLVDRSSRFGTVKTMETNGRSR